MDDIIKRLEALELPCRECDCLIGVALGWFVTEPNKGWPDQLDYIDVRDEYWSYPGGGFAQLVPRFTASIDAAMALVPEGWRAAFEQGAWNDKEPDKSIAWVWPFESSYDPDWQLGQETQFSNPDGMTGYAATPAIALCIAALKARNTSNG